MKQATSLKENIPIAFDTAAFLRVNLQQLEIRVGSLERRMPLVERTTASLQSILSTTKARPSRKSGTISSQSSSGPSSGSSTAHKSNNPFRTIENGDFEPQLLRFLQAGICSDPGSNPMTIDQTSNFIRANGKEPSRRSEDSPTSTLIDEMALEGKTLCRPTSGDNRTQTCFDAETATPRSPKPLETIEVWEDQNWRGPCLKCDAAGVPSREDEACQCPVYNVAWDQFMTDLEENEGGKVRDSAMVDNMIGVIPNLWTEGLFNHN
jgi:hypothetical protein